MVEPPVLQQRSWENLPLLILDVTVKRNPLNSHHQEVLKNANYMKMSVIGAYNNIIPYNETFQYIIATQMPLYNEQVPIVLNNDVCRLLGN